MNSKMLSILGMAVACSATSYATGNPRFDEKKVSGKLKGASIPKGLQRFIINGVEVYAINRKNAVKKASKILTA